MERLTKRLIWLYFILLVFEGALRKWIVPGLSTPLLIVRDPLVLGIYVCAFAGNLLVMRGPILLLAFMALASTALAVIAQTDPVVMIYGLRINYLHVPLIFIMADLLDRDDVLRFGRVILLLTPPMTVLMIAQYLGGEYSWLNADSSGDIGGQLSGALGRVRPSGPFSFTSGPTLWYPLAAAFAMHGWLHRQTYPRWLLVAATVAIVTAIPVSISRMLMFSVLGVALMGALSIIRSPARIFPLMLPALLILILGGSIGGGELSESFAERWDSSTSGGLQQSVVNRALGTYLDSFAVTADVPLQGHGIGVGSNVGARFATGQTGFMLAESEWSKIIMELGPLLGWMFIAYRCWLTLKLFRAGLGNLLHHGDSLPWLLAAAAMQPVLSGQWAPPTILGFAVFGAGLTLAAVRFADDADGCAEEPAGDDEEPAPA